MKKSLPYLLSLFFISCLLWSVVLTPVHAQPPGWSGDDNLAFQLIINGVSAADSDAANPIAVDLAVALPITLSIEVGLENITINSGSFVMQYMSIPILNDQYGPPQPGFGTPIFAGFTGDMFNTSIDLSSLQGVVTANIVGSFTFVYSLVSAPGVNTTVTDDFVLSVGGAGGLGALTSITGMITVGFAVIGAFSLLMALDEFQQGIFAARKMRGAKKGSDVGIFPRQVVLRRKPKKKKDSETINNDDLIARVSSAASQAWDGRRCPKCGKKWGKDKDACTKCDIDRASALKFFSQNIAEYAPKALNVVRPKSKITVGKFSKKLRLKPDKGGALAAALVDMGIFQTKTVKVPLKKVSMAGLSLAGTYWSWMQLFGGAIPDLVVVALTTTAGLVISVIIGYLMNFLARIPALGYDQ